MQRVVNGTLYDTETSEYVARGDHGSDLSDASWSLYRTADGAFFEVVAGHDGVLEGFQPLTEWDARRFVERHANHLYEKYFGIAPQAKKSLFSRRTVITAIDVIELDITQNDLSALLVDFGQSVYEHISNGPVKERLVQLKKFIDRNPAHMVDDGLLENLLVEKAIALTAKAKNSRHWGEPPAERAEIERFRRVLAQDGFTPVDGELRRSLPADLALPQVETELTGLLRKHGFATPLGHLEQALDGHARGQWASSNAQIRTYYEGLLDELAFVIDRTSRNLPSSENRRALLATRGFLSVPLNEWGNDGKNFINGLFKRLHPAGSHPGLSNEDDNTFRIHTVLLTTLLLMKRFERGAT